MEMPEHFPELSFQQFEQDTGTTRSRFNDTP